MVGEALVPIFFQLIIGGVGGFLIGYTIKKFVKIAVILGIIVFFLIFLAYTNVIRVDYEEFARAVSNFAKAVNPTLGLLAPILSNLPLICSLAIGLIVGFKKG